MIMKEKNITGKPSIDRPWLKFYPDEIKQLCVPECTLADFLKNACPGKDVVAMHYYGTDFTWETIFEEADLAAKALKAYGFGEGDQIPVFFRSVPQFLFLLLAAEKIGASLLCRDNTLEENVDAVKKANVNTIFAHDFLSRKHMDAYVYEAGIEHVILLSPYESADRNAMPPHIHSCIINQYTKHPAKGPSTVTWTEFLDAGRNYTGEVNASVDWNRPLFRAYTSGSTGPSKQVIHSAHTMIGVLQQLAPYAASGDFRPTWLLTALPPVLVAVVVSMILMPLASNKLLILDPFCELNDLDLEIMRYRPNCWPHIPMFLELIMGSKRIPADYDLSHLLFAGAGCEALNNGQLARAQKYLNDHNCKAIYTTGYGQSEAGSSITLPCFSQPIENGNIGIPMPLNTIGIFEPGTQEELSYNQIGEICVSGPGNMLGYDSKSATKKALQLHADGMVWLHTGDIGYMNEEGIVFALTRGHCERYGGGRLIDLTMENKVVDAKIPGIVDEFFVTAPDEEHKGYFLPYLFVVLEDGCTVDDVRESILAVLDDHEIPVEIIELAERPFFHFKTNRIGLKEDLKVKKAV